MLSARADSYGLWVHLSTVWNLSILAHSLSIPSLLKSMDPSDLLKHYVFVLFFFFFFSLCVQKGSLTAELLMK